MEKIIINNLKKVYGKNENEIWALNDVSFELVPGELTVILGPSGSGKSTLLNILGGMDNCTDGAIFIGNKEITSLSEKQLIEYRRNDIGFVFQFYNIMTNLTALENVELAEAKNGLKSKEVLKMVGLEKRLNNFPSQLSGGEQQRVAIARAIVKNPKLLLCDEPTGALDSNTGKSIIKLLLSLAKNNKQTIVIVTHNVKLALVANRVIKLSDGKVIENMFIEKPLDVEEIEW